MLESIYVMKKAVALLIVLALIVLTLIMLPIFLQQSMKRGEREARTFHVPIENTIKENIVPIIEKSTSTVPEPGTVQKNVPQFVVFSFDGSRSIQAWEQTLDFADQMKSENKPISFTYFISGVYLLDPQHKDIYQPPNEQPGTSKIGFADSEKDVYARIHEINRAIDQGHEIASHLNGHFDGTKWTTQDWTQEFQSFINFILNPEANNNLNSAKYQKDPLKLKAGDIIGFRAPLLAVNNALWPVMKQFGYKYDAGHIAKADSWPAKNSAGIWQFPLPSIALAGTNRHMLAMDYNFYTAQTKATDTLKKGTPEWDAAYKQVLDSYLEYFNKNYNGNRAPVYEANHFSEWNDGLYWEAMKSFAQQVCGLPDVKCVNFRDLVDYMEAKK